MTGSFHTPTNQFPKPVKSLQTVAKAFSRNRGIFNMHAPVVPETSKVCPIRKTAKITLRHVRGGGGERGVGEGMA